MTAKLHTFEHIPRGARSCALALLLAGTGCLAPDPAVEAPATVKQLLAGAFGTMTEYRKPVYTSRRHPLPPFVTLKKGPKATELLVSPFFRWQDDPRHKRLQVLWPLLSYRERAGSWGLWIMPAFHASEVVREAPGGGKISDFDWMLFPLLWYGSETGVGKYFALFPLFGKIRDFFGKDEVWFALFPVYMQTRVPEYTAHHILWPLIGWWDGPRRKGAVRQHGFRIFPFYAQDIRDGKFVRRAALWPLFSWWKFALDTNNPGFGWLSFPFAGHVHNSTYDEWTVLALFNWSHDRKRNETRVHAPWPFFFYAEGDGISALKVWPIAGFKDVWAEGYRAHHEFALWPLYQRSHIRTREYELHWRSLGLRSNPVPTTATSRMLPH